MTGHAEGGHAAPLPKWSTETFDQEGAESNQQPPNPTVTPPESNIVQRIDVTSIANDMPGDSDYDDPYPGGATKTLGVPGDG
jgi:hypothetical protein